MSAPPILPVGGYVMFGEDRVKNEKLLTNQKSVWINREEVKLTRSLER